MSIRGIINLPASEWAAYARACPEHSYRQAPGYSLELADLRRATCEFVVLPKQDQAVESYACASVRVRSLPIIGGGLAYVSGGPLLSLGLQHPDSPVAFQRALEGLKAEYVTRRQLVLRVVPPPVEHGREWVPSVFERCGFRSAEGLPPYRTIIVDIGQSDAAIRAAFEHKWRNQLNAALRRGTQVELTTDAQAVSRFAPLLEEVRLRKGFETELGADFFDRVQRRSEEWERLMVAFATVDGRDVAGVVASLTGTTSVYILGATTQDGMKSKASYALHWHVILAARNAGCRWYDLGGVDPERNPGVYHFKAGFGGRDVTFPGAFEVIPTGGAGLLSRIVAGGYARVKNLRGK